MTKTKPVIAMVRSGNKNNAKIVTVPKSADIEVGDYVAFMKIDSESIGKLIGA